MSEHVSGSGSQPTDVPRLLVDARKNDCRKRPQVAMSRHSATGAFLFDGRSGRAKVQGGCGHALPLLLRAAGVVLGALGVVSQSNRRISRPRDVSTRTTSNAYKTPAPRPGQSG